MFNLLRPFAFTFRHVGPLALALVCVGTSAAAAQATLPQPPDSEVLPPVIDVHVHAMNNDAQLPPMCPFPPGFQASDPKDKEAQFGWTPQDCTPKLYGSKPGEYRNDVLAEMKRLNVTAVVFGDPDGVDKWKAAAPDRVIKGTAFSVGAKAKSESEQLSELRKDFEQHGFKVSTLR